MAAAKIYHDKVSYNLSPNTAISDFKNMTGVTSVETGELYLYVFTGKQYQGEYKVFGPDSKIMLKECGSMITSTEPISPLLINKVQNNKRAPEKFWELTAPMYVLFFSPIYKYVV